MWIENIHIDFRVRRIIKKLYKPKRLLKIDVWEKVGSIIKGIRFHNLSPVIFNIYVEQAVNECRKYCTEIKVNRYSDSQMISQ